MSDARFSTQFDGQDFGQTALLLGNLGRALESNPADETELTFGFGLPASEKVPRDSRQSRQDVPNLETPVDLKDLLLDDAD